MSERASVLERPVLDPEADSVSDSEHDRICMREDGNCLAGLITMRAIGAKIVYALPAELQTKDFTLSVLPNRFKNVGADIKPRRSNMHHNQRERRGAAVRAGKYMAHVVMPEATFLAMGVRQNTDEVYGELFREQIARIHEAAHEWPNLQLQILPDDCMTGLEGADYELAVADTPVLKRKYNFTQEPMFDGDAQSGYDNPAGARRFLQRFRILSERALSTEKTKAYLDELVAARN